MFVPADAAVDDVEQRIVEAAALLPRFGGVTGWAALRWLGALWFSGEAADGSSLPVDLATMGCDIRSQDGIRVSEERLDPTELTVVDDLPISTPLRSATFAMRHASGVRAAVVVADMAMYADLMSIDDLVRHYWIHGSYTGNPQMLEAAGLAEESSWSPQETLSLRLPWVLDAEFPRPLCNRPVFDLEGRLIGTPDLLDEEAGVVGEYDGPVHLAGHRRGVDVRREAAFRGVGLETFVVTAADAGHRDDVVRRMAEARSRARFAAPSTRGWTIEPPPWWTRTDTVEARRALDDDQRRRFLAYRIS